MPRPPRFRIAALDDLRRQLVYAPTEARSRQLDACEALIATIEPEQNYPEEFVIFRITGYRREGRGETSTLVGEALVADLATLVLRLSEDLELSPQSRPGGAVTLESLARRLGTSIRTIQRWRNLGLLQHWIDFPNEGRRVGCFASSIDAFAARCPDLMAVRARRTRVDDDERAALITRAGELRAESGASLTTVARRLAQESGRAAETIRQILQRHDAAAAAPLFRERPALSDRQKVLIERAWRFGVPIDRLATHLRRSAGAVHRQLLLRRAERLRTVQLRWVELPTFRLPDAEEVILGAEPVRRGLLRLTGASDALELFTLLRASPAATRPDPAAGKRESETAEPTERAALLAALNMVKRLATTRINELPAVPTTAPVDRIETLLRHLTLIQHSLLASMMTTALARADAWAGCSVERLPSEEIRGLIPELVRVCLEAIERIDPSRGQRLDRRVALDTDKALARRSAATGPRRQRATAGHVARGVPIADPFMRVAPWQEWLDPPPRWRERLGSLPASTQRAVSLHYGLDGTAPQTLSAIARALRTSEPGASRLVQNGLALLRRPG